MTYYSYVTHPPSPLQWLRVKESQRTEYPGRTAAPRTRIRLIVQRPWIVAAPAHHLLRATENYRDTTPRPPRCELDVYM